MKCLNEEVRQPIQIELSREEALHIVDIFNKLNRKEIMRITQAASEQAVDAHNETCYELYELITTFYNINP